MLRTDSDIQKDVADELEWDPSLEDDDIARTQDAERAARNAPGITEVENRLTVDPSVYATV